MEREQRYNYRECLRNHAASLGSYATDGCGEFTAVHGSSQTYLQCAACGCHRNFHRKVMYSSGSRGELENIESTMELMEYADGGIVGCIRRSQEVLESPEGVPERSGKKRFRTKFTPDQKEKMLSFAKKLGWKLLRKDEEDEVERFCKGVGVNRQVFKVWMHNHKNNSSSSSAASASTGNASSLSTQ